jgi:hypothetical protein
MRFAFLLILIPTLAHSQPKNYFSIAFGKDFPNGYHVIGGHFTENRLLGKNFYLGAGASFLKFDNTTGFYFPVYGNVSYLKFRTDKKIFPVVLIQPGYGFYKQEEDGTTTKGGFTFHGSAGIGYPFLFHKKGYATFGFAHYTFKEGEITSYRNAFGGRLAFLL